MATLTINGKKVTVDDSFLKLTPEQQNATVDEIAKSLGPQQMDQAGFASHLAGGEQSPNIERAAPQQQRPDLMNSTIATVNGIVNGIPVAGPMAQAATDAIGGGISQITGGNFNDYVKRQRAIRENAAKTAPVASFMGNLGGSMASLGALGALPGGAEALGMNGGALLPRMVNSGLSSQGLYTADQLARGKQGTDTLGYGVPAMVGAAAPAIGDLVKAGGKKIADTVTGMSQRGLNKAATVGAPSADELKAASRAMFDAVDNSGVTISTDKFSGVVKNLVSKAKVERINQSLNPQSFAVFQELIGALDDVQKNGGTLTLGDLHVLRQIAQDAAIQAKPRDARFANMIIDALDNFVTSPGAAVMPKNQIGNGGAAAGNELLKAIGTWGKAKRVGLLEEAIYKAQNQASGFENGLRTQFRQLLQNPKTRSLFNEAELQSIQDVARGTTLANALKLLGKFGFSANNMLGGVVGGIGGGTLLSGGNPLGGVALAAAGTVARKGSEAMTRNAADLAARVVATPGIPIARQAPNLLAPMAKPLELMIRGGSLMPGR